MKKTMQIILSVVLYGIVAVISGCDGDGAGNQAPTASITSPFNNSTYTYGDIVTFMGTGTDPEDGNVSESTFVWRSNHDGLLNSGRNSFSTSSLSVGTHTISLTVTDKDLADGEATINVIIHTSMPDDTFTNSIGMTFVKINPGTFMMGSPEDEPGRDDDETRHQVTLTKGYYMQTTEVSQSQWTAVMGNNPSSLNHRGDDFPVNCVSWNDAQEFIAALNTREGTRKYRLPTEAEWEYAARAGTSTPFAFGRCLSTDQANYCGNYSFSDCPKGIHRKKTVAVGTLAKNAWGLYDMHGNVSEWVEDWYGSYPTEAVTDPIGLFPGAYRVLRGGHWNGVPSFCRSANRSTGHPDSRNFTVIGFRLARTL